MSSYRAGCPLFGGHLQAADVFSSRPALAGIMRVLAGNARCYYEHLKGGTGGATPIDGQAPCAPYGPRAVYGEDHSGAGFGKPLKHTLAHLTWPDVSGSVTNREPPTVNRTFSNGDEVVGYNRVHRVLIPACYEGGAYESVEARAVFYVTSAKASTTAYLRIYSEAQGGLAGGEDVGGSSLELTTSCASTGTYADSGTLLVIPGAINRIRLKLSVPYSAGGGSVSVRLVCLGLSQVS